MNHAYCLALNPGWKMMRLQLALNKTFYPTPQPLTHRRLKQCQRTKINKTMLFASLPPTHPPPSVFHTKFITSELKSKKVFLINGK